MGLRKSREPDFKKGSLKQTTARFQRAHETLRDFTQITPKWAHIMAGRESDHRPDLR